MSGSTESKLDILALAYDHYRILRDSATRADDYVERILTRGGKVLEDEFWIELPEPVITISLREIKNAITALVGELEVKMVDVKAQVTTIAEDLKLDKNVDYLLYTLAQKQQTTKKPPIKKDLEEEWDERNSTDEISPLDSLAKLPSLGPNQQYEYVGEKGSPDKIWKIIDLVPNEVKPKEKTTFSLKRRPKQ